MATLPKLSRPCDNSDDVSIKQAIDKIQEEQQKIDALNEGASEEILSVEQKYNRKRQPHFEARNKHISLIPKFWLTTFVNHPQVSELLNRQDERILEHLTKVEVKEADDIKSGFSIHFYFDKNDYFKNSVLTKEFKLGESGEPSSTHTNIDWYPHKDITIVNKGNNGEQGKKRTYDGPVQDSFFCWFSEGSSALGDELGELIKDDIWPNPLQYYLPQDVEEDNENDEEDEDEDEDEDDQDLDEEEEEVADI